ncbi:hypothetical protein RQP46_006065 [Phenoliferia psychrophenolica]
MQPRPVDGLFGTGERLRKMMEKMRFEEVLKDEERKERQHGRGAAAAASSGKGKGKRVHVPQPPKDGSCPLNWLAPELLDHILSLVATIERADMRETCLVARRWQLPSQAQLWKELVFLPMDDMLEDILLSASCGKFKAEEVTFQGATGVAKNRSGPVASLVRQLDGIRTLQIAEHEQLDPTLFTSPTLTKLTNLEINHSTFTPLRSVMTIPFRLTRFELTGDAALPPLLLTSLLTPAFRTLTTLALNLCDRLSAFSTLVTLFPSFAPSLTRLELSDPYPTLLPLLSSCTSLSSLRLSTTIRASAVEAILDSLKTPLDTLEICLNIDEWDITKAWKHLEARDVLVAIAVFLEIESALSELSELVFVLEGESETSLDELGEMKEVRDRAEERGVEVIVDDEGRESYDF